MPVIASAGLSVEAGKAFAKAAEEAGADGILLMPPYLTECPQDGLVEYARQICDATSVNVIYYNRGNGILNAHSVQQLADQRERRAVSGLDRRLILPFSPGGRLRRHLCPRYLPVRFIEYSVALENITIKRQ